MGKKEIEGLMNSNLRYLNKSNYKRRIQFFKRISLNGFKEAFIRRPELASLMILDLLTVGNHTEDDISLGSNISINSIQLVRRGFLFVLSGREQFDLIDFYFRVLMKKR